MRRSPEQAIAGVLRPLSSLLKEPLELDAANGGVRRADGQPLNDVERQLMGEILDLVGLAHEHDARLQALDARVSALQAENLDLIAKNSFLSEISARDSLTGLYNRWYVMEKIDSEMNRAMRHGYPMSVLMLDLDHFKSINDSYGHPAGDAVLKSVGQVLKDSCRVYDVAGRYGGEEFCIVLPETKVGGTTTVAERIRERLASTPQTVGQKSIIVTASIGIAGVDSVSDDGVLSASALVERADRALYAAKHHGRNRVELWAPSANGH
jgi:diguanylate cyclase (GGDEF)-like protein